MATTTRRWASAVFLLTTLVVAALVITQLWRPGSLMVTPVDAARSPESLTQMQPNPLRWTQPTGLPFVAVPTVTGELSVDRLVEVVAQAHGVTPAPLVDDDAFLRRVTIDLIGRIPTPEEYEQYHDDPAPRRRELLVDRLLAHPRWVQRWAIFLGDLFRVRQDAKGGRELARFFQESLRKNVAYDDLVRELLTAIGSTNRHGAAGFIVAEDAQPLELAGVVTQSLLGVRMKCAQCHDHPFDTWTRKEYYQIAAYFGHTGQYEKDRPFKVLHVTHVREPRVLWPPVENVAGKPQRALEPIWPVVEQFADAQQIEQAITELQVLRAHRQHQVADELFHLEETNDKTRGLAREMAKVHDDLAKHEANRQLTPLRDELAAILTNPRHPAFSRALVNRMWAQFFDCGMVDPVDDFRGDNPPSHPQLLDYLATQFIAHGYDFKSLQRLIVLSHAYQRQQLEQTPPLERATAERLFVAAPLRRMLAEAMYDSLIVAGRLDGRKHAIEDFRKERQVTIAIARNQDAVNAQGQELLQQELLLTPMMRQANSAEGDYFDQLLADEMDPLRDLRLLAVGVQEMVPAEIIEEARKRVEAQLKGKVEYEYKTVTRVVDETPRFGWAVDMAAPAPGEHFLRQFGQSDRVLLGETRDPNPNLRQALILMNGQLANEAAKVGRREPLYSLLQQDDLTPAIIRVYLEALTRQPTAAEIAQAQTVIESAADRLAGMADLRWALLNCHEFRYLP